MFSGAAPRRAAHGTRHTRALGRPWRLYVYISRGTGDRLYGCFNVTSSQVIPVRPGTKTPRRWDSTHLPTQGQHPLCRLQPRTAVCVSRAPHWLVPAFLRGYESARQKSLTTQTLMQWVSMGRQNEATRSLAAMLAPSSRGPRFEGARPRVPAIPACVWPLWQPEAEGKRRQCRVAGMGRCAWWARSTSIALATASSDYGGAHCRTRHLLPTSMRQVASRASTAEWQPRLPLAASRRS